MLKLGREISPILNNIEEILWETEAAELGLPEFTNEGFRSATKIFMAALMEQIYKKARKEKTDQKSIELVAEMTGKEIRKIILSTTGINPPDWYDK